MYFTVGMYSTVPTLLCSAPLQRRAPASSRMTERATMPGALSTRSYTFNMFAYLRVSLAHARSDRVGSSSDADNPPQLHKLHKRGSALKRRSLGEPALLDLAGETGDVPYKTRVYQSHHTVRTNECPSIVTVTHTQSCSYTAQPFSPVLNRQTARIGLHLYHQTHQSCGKAANRTPILSTGHGALVNGCYL